jgi:hypothetical protein
LCSKQALRATATAAGRRRAFRRLHQAASHPRGRFGTVAIPCQQAAWTQLGVPHVTLRRTQLPLCTCLAMTVHKSQGMTLSRAVLDIGRCRAEFSAARSTVALSRVRRLEDIALCAVAYDEWVALIKAYTTASAGLQKRTVWIA